MVFGQSLVLASLASSPTHLAKNEREDICLDPVVVPSFVEGGGDHPLHLVGARHSYVQLTPQASLHSLFLWPESGRPCSTANVATLLKCVILEVDPASLP